MQQVATTESDLATEHLPFVKEWCEQFTKNNFIKDPDHVESEMMVPFVLLIREWLNGSKTAPFQACLITRLESRGIDILRKLNKRGMNGRTKRNPGEKGPRQRRHRMIVPARLVKTFNNDSG